MRDLPNNETRQRLLDAAELLFIKRGYASVKLRDIAEAVGLHHASLYYYAPGGKEQLFVEVMQRSLNRHREGMTQAAAQAGRDLHAQVYAIAAWLAQQPPLDLQRMAHADLREIDPAQAEALMMLAFDALRLPLAEVLHQANAAGSATVANPELAAIAFVQLMQSVHNIPELATPEARQAVGYEMADMLLNGWLKR
ncbi:MAG: TetR/AcrR family transcriptional regulator [Armatimonadetes bacterium]|nr:TetR/AcrR family transcriptional regulator [Anaerolineae bacterium]